MKAGISAFSCLIVYLVVCTCKAHTNITAYIGENVTLSIKVPNNKNITAVKCSRPDQDPDYVLLVRDGHFDAHKQHPSYQNRVDLQDKEMKDGDVSLILMNVMKNDTGTYMCWVHQIETYVLKTPIPITKTNYTVYLEVVEPGNKDGGDNTGIIVGAAVGVILLLAVLASVRSLIRRGSTKKNPNLPVRPVDEAAAEQML